MELKEEGINLNVENHYNGLYMVEKYIWYDSFYRCYGFEDETSDLNFCFTSSNEAKAALYDYCLYYL